VSEVADKQSISQSASQARQTLSWWWEEVIACGHDESRTRNVEKSRGELKRAHVMQKKLKKDHSNIM